MQDIIAKGFCFDYVNDYILLGYLKSILFGYSRCFYDSFRQKKIFYFYVNNFCSFLIFLIFEFLD